MQESQVNTSEHDKHAVDFAVAAMTRHIAEEVKRSANDGFGQVIVNITGSCFKFMPKELLARIRASKHLESYTIHQVHDAVVEGVIRYLTKS